MIHLLKIEWLKLRKYLAFILLSSFFILGVVFLNYIVFLIEENLIKDIKGAQMVFSGSFFEFSRVWLTVSYYGSYFLMLPALLMVILVTNEYSYKTHRQNIIDGLSRFEFLKVKLALAVILAIASTLVVILTGLIFGLASGTSFALTGFENVGYFLLKAITYNMVAILIALLTKRSGVAIAVFFVYTILENGISGLLFFLAIKIKRDSGTDLGNLGNYLPMNASDGLLASPLQRFTQMASGVLPKDIDLLVLAFALAYICLFYWWSKRKFLRADL